MSTIKSLLNPETVAVIGASTVAGKVGHDILHNLIEDGFAGTIVPVNPKAEEILGIKTFSSLNDFDGKIDLSIIAIPSHLVYNSVEESIKSGAKSICVISAGFKEIGEEGANLEKKLTELCNKNSVHLLGPNCLGLINTHHSMNASFAKHMPKKGSISVISQSGALCTAILD